MSEESNPYADFGKEPKPNPFESPAAESAPIFESDGPPLSLKQILFSTNGRIPRRVYWGANIAVGFCFYGAVIAIAILLGATLDEETADVAATVAILALYPFMLWVTVCVQAKRWHDRDKSGWMFCINFIPIIGPIWTFVECGCLRGSFGTNQYGSDPT